MKDGENGEKNMDLNKFSNIIRAITLSYPNFKSLEDPEGLELWYRNLCDIPQELLEIAVGKYISTNVFPPSIAQLRQYAMEIVTGQDTKNETTAWSLVQRAIRNYGSYREQEALEWIKKEDQIAGLVTQRIGFKDLCLSENIIADRAHFQKAYQITKHQEEKEKSLPVYINKAQKRIRSLQGTRNIKDIIQEIAETKTLKAGD